MKSSRFALFAFAALVEIGTLAGSAHYSPLPRGDLVPTTAGWATKNTWPA